MKPVTLVCSAFLCGACGSRTAAPSPEPPAADNRVEATGGVREVQVCVLESGRLRVVQATYDPATGDTLAGGRPWAEVFSDTAGYAANRPWYVSNEPITVEGRRYTKYGPLRILPPSGLRPGGRHEGTTFFIEANAGGTPEVIYVPTRPGCEFHAYQWDLTTGGVRGGG
jgi:hypothetical protein